MNIPLIGRAFDERFLNHRLRSTSIGGVAGGVLATLLFAYHYCIDHYWSWELLAVALTIVAVKWALMAWQLWRR
jgi:hypothetical protein